MSKQQQVLLLAMTPLLPRIVLVISQSQKIRAGATSDDRP
jgi:hypothetical protein